MLKNPLRLRMGSVKDLPNRVLLQDRVQQALARHRRGGRPFAVAFMPLPRGHPRLQS
ncbi:hypothetical protein [Deinococcus sp. ME38]|uniref:hypothetical protein n=1 Tax=Deinococcus sp. ME38 TaxID=3400344 RepID=UPI003B5BE5CA